MADSKAPRPRFEGGTHGCPTEATPVGLLQTHTGPWRRPEAAPVAVIVQVERPFGTRAS